MKKLFTILCASVASISAQAQIIYTDVNPDTTVAAKPKSIEFYQIDLNNDKTYEHRLGHFNDPSGMSVELFANGSSETIVDGIKDAVPLALNDTIAPTRVWGTNVTGHLNDPKWYTGKDVYIGLRFQISGQYHYGWVRASMPADKSSFTVKDYAYNSQPNQMILAGQKFTTSASSYSKLNGFSIAAQNRAILITSKKSSIAYNVAVFNMNGQKMYEQTNARDYLTIDMSAQPMGTYIVLLTTDKGQMSYKLFVQ